MAKITVKIGETESEIELSNEQLSEIKTAHNFLTKEEALANQEFFDAHKMKHKKEVLDGFDAILKKYETDLTNEEMEAYKKGDTTFKKADHLIQTLKTRLSNSGDKAELEIWKQEVEKERKIRESDYVTKADYENAQKANAKLNKQIIGNYAVMEAVSSGILDETWNEKPIFKTVLKEAINETLKSIEGKTAKLIYDAETGDIKVASTGEGSLPIIKSGTTEYWTFGDVVKKTITDNKMNKVAQVPKVVAGEAQKTQNLDFFTSTTNDRINQLRQKIKQE
jgi:hypothetical protein